MKPAIAISILAAVSFICGNTITWLPLPTLVVLGIIAAILITLAIILLRWAMRVPAELTTPGPRRYHLGFDPAVPGGDLTVSFTGTVQQDGSIQDLKFYRKYPVHLDEFRNSTHPPSAP